MIFDLKRFSANTALQDEQNEPVSYEKLAEYSDNLYSCIKERCTVLSFCKNSLGSVIGYVSFICNKVVPILINERTEKENISFIIRSYRPAYVWLPKSLSDYFLGYKTVFSVYDYILIKTEFVPYDLYPDLGALISTSGSTGSPKYIRLSYKNLEANAESIASYLEIDSKEKTITTLPMNYSYGLSIINSHLIKGATILLTDKSLMQKDFWEFFRKNRVSSFGGVPFTYQMLKKLKFFNMKLPSLKTMTQAGGKLPFDLHKEFAEYALVNGIRFFAMYGQSEATARISYLPYNDSLRKCGSVGIPIPGGRLYLEDSNGKIVTEPHIQGELYYEGANVSLGYALGYLDLSLGDKRHGLLKTGDIAYYDEDGYFFITGRLSRFLKIFGNRVNLDEVESLLRAQYKDIQLACSGYDDNLYVFIEGKDEPHDIRKFLANKTGINLSAFKIVLVDLLPKNQSGKILYKDLKNHFHH